MVNVTVRLVLLVVAVAGVTPVRPGTAASAAA